MSIMGSVHGKRGGFLSTRRAGVWMRACIEISKRVCGATMLFACLCMTGWRSCPNNWLHMHQSSSRGSPA
eukprot:4148795-Amphidinium_carterae.1